MDHPIREAGKDGMILALFDIDGTLISTGGAGMRAFNRSLAAKFGLQAADGTVHPDGKTDPLILREILAHFGLDTGGCAEIQADVFASYLRFLDEEMGLARTGGTIRVLAGVKELLDRLAVEPGFCTGLVTGNLEEGARIKLRHAGLDGYFKFGGYGSDSENRTELTRTAILRGVRHIAPSPMEAAFVIGDTPLDIAHGRAAGARTIAVASAGYGMEELAPHEPDLLVADLTEVQAIIRFMRNGNADGVAETTLSVD